MKAPIEVQFAQKLAANDPTMRNKAVKKLKKWFAARQEPFSESEMMRLWKGLYYCFWMSDKPLVQEELAENISSFVPSFNSPDASLLFIKCFLLTMGREWVGIDRWRTEKFMMLTRRFLRGSFRFLSARSWEESLVKEAADIFREDVMLCLPPRTSVDFQLHFTDVFLEELAKVAGQNLKTELLDILLTPFVDVVQQCEEERLREHVVERIFKHLIRQSDPGIKWQDEEFEQDSGNEEDVDEEDGSDDDEEEGDKGDGDGDSGEGDELVAPDDPRAGGVHAVIPQLAVDYQRISEMMFKVGSDEGIKSNNRQALYQLSKMFKDTANDIFPLGPNVEDDEEIPKIKISKETKKLMKKTAEARERNLKEKLNFKKALKVKNNPVAENGVEDSHETNGDAESEEDEEMTPAESESVVSATEESKASSKELKKKRKREQKRRKKERLMAEAADNEIKEKKSKEMIDQDIQRVNSVVNGNEGKQKKLQEKQLKFKEIEEKKKKKKKSLEKSATSSVESEQAEAEVRVEVNGADSSETAIKKKKKKKSRGPVEQVESTDQEDKRNDTMLSPTQATLESFEKIKKKKEKKKAKEKKPLYRIDSDIAFNAPSLSQINLTKLDEKKPEVMEESKSEDRISKPEVAPVEQVTKKKKLKKYNAETSLLVETPSKPSAVQEQSSPKAKKKKKSSETPGSGPEPSPKSSKMFEEDNSWGDLQPGESEIILPNKKYKGDVQLKPVEEVPSPSVTPVKNFTATFLKKALSKSEKKAEKKKKILPDPSCLSEPRKKKVNVVLTKNCVQDFGQHLKSVKNSPQTPHDPNKNPTKSALKSTPSGPAPKTLNPVQLNTQLNGRSSTAKKLAGKNRKRAADFF